MKHKLEIVHVFVNEDNETTVSNIKNENNDFLIFINEMNFLY